MTTFSGCICIYIAECFLSSTSREREMKGMQQPSGKKKLRQDVWKQEEETTKVSVFKFPFLGVGYCRIANRKKKEKKEKKIEESKKLNCLSVNLPSVAELIASYYSIDGLKPSSNSSPNWEFHMGSIRGKKLLRVVCARGGQREKITIGQLWNHLSYSKLCKFGFEGNSIEKCTPPPLLSARIHCHCRLHIRRRRKKM